jgi:hypothetical protein
MYCVLLNVLITRRSDSLVKFSFIHLPCIAQSTMSSRGVKINGKQCGISQRRNNSTGRSVLNKIKASDKYDELDQVSLILFLFSLSESINFTGVIFFPQD